MRGLLGFAVVVSATVFLGCGSEQSFSRAAVEGMVNVRGEPVESGRIMFIAEGDRSSPPTVATIEKGRYALTAENGPVLGVNRVEITAMRKTGKKIPVPDQPGQEVEEEEQFIPLQFNSQSDLSATIQAGENKHNFDLQWNARAGS